MKRPLIEGDRIVVKFSDGPIMGYFMNYYAGYAVCELDDQPYGHFLAERQRVSKAPDEPTPPPANIQIFEATVSMHREAPEDHAPPPTKQGGLSG